MDPKMCRNCERRLHKDCSNAKVVMTSQDLEDMVLDRMPKEAQIVRVEYEWPRIAMYTSNLRFLQQNSYFVAEVVEVVNRKVIVRTEEAEKQQTTRAAESRRFQCCCCEETWTS